MQDFIPGQRWISNAELHLGLGTVVAVDFRTVNIVYLANGETRTYAKQSAPLTRVAFVAGDSALSHEGWSLSITSVQEQDGLLTYHGTRENGSAASLEEGQLDNFIQLNRPTDRLFTHQIDKNKWFELRLQTHQLLNQSAQSSLRGLTGGRTSLIAHQLYIAHEVANRYAPRVLLADEVGLGKTIEAGMILHQQIITERAHRALIIVPETLLHQWLVEMLRRFNLFFSVFDQERCLAAEESTQQENPFQTEQLVICTLDFLVQHPHHYQQALSADWDLMIVDEAHHLQWSPQESSIEYKCIEQLAAVTKGVLLLTATPEQLGKQSHFARLRLLDPDRFHDFDSYLQEEKSYKPIAHAVDVLLNKAALDQATIDLLKSTIDEGDNQALLDNLLNEEDCPQLLADETRNTLVEHLLDRHGTGRVLFRNTRAAIKGFPSRELHAYPLALPEQYSYCLADLQNTGLNDTCALLCPEIIYQQTHSVTDDHWTTIDPRTQWLNDRLKQLSKDKVLVITATAETALDLIEYLRTTSGIHAAVFHEGMSIVERDRAAAFFADKEYGSQVLICSEIGSEGRNFQFSHHLILFDLPLNPDLLEQRIGRLDRIGQTETIQIHTPYLQDSAQAIMFNWYHQGLNAFEHTCPSGHNVFTQVKDTLLEALHQIDEGITDLPALMATTRQLNQVLLQELQQGRDQLLEYNSCRPGKARSITQQAVYEDTTVYLTGFLENCFDCYGIDHEEHSDLCLIARPSDHMSVASFPGLNEEGITLTCDRETALANEDIHFITRDHPMITGATELILCSESGNTAVVAVKNTGIKPGTLLLETLFVLESTGDINMKHTRSIPTMIRLLTNQNGHELSEKIPTEAITQNLENIKNETAVKIIQGFTPTLRAMVTESETLADSCLPDLVMQAFEPTITKLDTEISRLRALKKVNPNVREDEIHYFQGQRATLLKLKASARLRLDALRVIITL